MSNNFDKDTVLFEENDPQIYIETNPTKDNKYIIINSLSKHDSKISLLNLTDKSLTPTTIFERVTGVKYFVEHCEVKLFLLRIPFIFFLTMIKIRITWTSNYID